MIATPNKLSEWGLIHKINQDVLHPLGLALARDEENNIIIGAEIADDFVFKFSEKANERNKIKYNNFIKNRINILKEEMCKKTDDKLTSAEWASQAKIVVLDPDGWDRSNFRYSWFEEKITKEEFDKRLMKSTYETMPTPK